MWPLKPLDKIVSSMLDCYFTFVTCPNCSTKFDTGWGLSQHVGQCCQKTVDDTTRMMGANRKKHKTSKADTTKHPNGTGRVSYTLKKERSSCPEAATSSNDSSCGSIDNWIENAVCNEAVTYFQGNNDIDSSGSETNGEQECNDDGAQEDRDGGSDQPLYNPSRKPAASATMPYQSESGIPPSWTFQIELADLLGRHQTDLKVYDDLIFPVKNHSNERKLKFPPTSLMNRESFLKRLETCLGSTSLKPRNVTVNLTKGAMTTVTMFDLQAMILSLLFHKSLMKSKNMVDGYDLPTGKVDRTPTHIGEIHTGDAWEEARAYFCGDNPNNMQLVLSFSETSHIWTCTDRCLPPLFLSPCPVLIKRPVIAPNFDGRLLIPSTSVMAIRK